MPETTIDLDKCEIPHLQKRYCCLHVDAFAEEARSGCQTRLWAWCLGGKEAIIGVEPYLVARLHGSSEDYTAKLTRGCGRDRLFKENSNMAALPRS